MKKYSDWLKIDLHLHTDLSKKTKEGDYQGDFSVETLYEKLTTNDVEIFSLTDHNIINLPAYEKYYENYTSDEDPLLLVGVELDIVVTTNDGLKTYHSLLIFNYNTIEKAKELSERLEEKYTSKGLKDKERKLTIEEIVDLFQEDDFFFIPHAGNTKSIISGYRENVEDAQKMVLLMQSAFEKVPEKNRQRYNEGFNRILHEAFQAQDDIAYIEFSDNHNINQYPSTHKGGANSKIHEFYYIKGSKNYETLRLSFIDPKSRIKSTNKYNEIFHLNNTIEKLKINNEPKLQDNEITFSPHLNVIIGGRSSGKSLLMNLLGTKIDKVSAEDKYKINNANILIKAKNDADYKTSISITENLIYINQGDIVHYFEEKKLEELAVKSGKEENYIENKSAFTEHKNEMFNILDNLVSSYELAHAIGKEKKYELHRRTLDNIFSEEYVIIFDNEELENKFDKSTVIQESKELIENINKDITTFKKSEVLDITDDETNVIDTFSKLLEEKSLLIGNKDKKNIKKSKFIKLVNTKITDKNGELSSGAQEKSLANNNLRDLKTEIKERFSKMHDLKQKCKALEDFNYGMTKKININDDVMLVLEVEYNEEMKKYLLDGINNSNLDKSIYLNILDLLLEKNSIKNLGSNTSEKLKQKFIKQLEPIKNMMDSPKDYLEYEDANISKDKSPGYNSEKYLEIILKNDNNKFIFIDQPEDNLGNRFIADTLVNILREIKFKKQIFLVTHNPAIAVYGDAECIIVAENNENIISYKQIVLEDRDAQKEICSILDGGEYIFDNRSRKYNIKRILSEEG